MSNRYVVTTPTAPAGFVKGDLIVVPDSSGPAVLAVGANDKILTADSTAPNGVAWKDAPASGASATSLTAIFEADGVTQVGWTAGQYGIYRTEGNSLAEWALQFGGGSAAPVLVSEGGGVIETAYAGGAGSSSCIVGDKQATLLALKGPGATDKFYVQMRAKIIGLSSDGTLLAGLVKDVNAMIINNQGVCAIIKNSGSGKYRLFLHDGTNSVVQDSAISYNDAYRLFRIWYQGGSSIKFAVDAESPITVNLGSVTLTRYTMGIAATGTSSTACNVALDAAVVMADRAA